MDYKLLALDIDGTVVKPHENIPSKKVTDAIKQASEKIHISLVSARAWKDQEMLIDLLSLQNNYHVVENGTKVVNPSREIEFDLRISSDEVRAIVSVSEGLFESVGYCIEGKWLPDYGLSDVSTISFISHNRQNADQIPKMLTKLPHNYVFSVGAHWSNNPSWAVTLISHKDASKGAGLRYVQEKLSILPSETIAVGDGASDVSTMKFAHVKAAMGNAEPELLKVASYTAPSVADDGLVDIIGKFIM